MMGKVTEDRPMDARERVPAPPAADPDLGPDEEAALIAASRQGATDAFTRLVHAHQTRIRSFLGCYIRRPELVDDLAQEVFLSAFRTLDGYQGGAPFRLWLVGIARNRALKHLRDELRRRSRETRSVELALVDFRARGLEEAPFAERERELAALEGCLERLPSPSAALVADHYFHGRALVDLAREQGRKESALRMMLLRIRQGLRDCVRQRFAEGTT